jgi:TPR repeat protein
MRIGVLNAHGLATLLAGLACFSFVVGQETKAPAEESLRERAEKGDADAQLTLGHTYFLKDKAEAVRWYRRAAGQGSKSPTPSEPDR